MSEIIVPAAQIFGRYSDDPDYDLQYEPCTERRARKRMMILMFKGKCTFECQYCFFHTLPYHDTPDRTFSEILKRLEKEDAVKQGPVKYRGIKSVLISGAEPTRWEHLPEIIREFKLLGKLVYLHTNGTNPDMLEELIGEGLLDFVAMDVKAPASKYNITTGVTVNMEDIQRSINLVKTLPEYKFRTCVARELLNKDDLINIAELLQGSKWYEIKSYFPVPGVRVGKENLTPYTNKEMNVFKKLLEPYVDKVTVLVGRRGLGGA